MAGLVAIAEAVAAVLAERQAELGISTELESVLTGQHCSNNIRGGQVCDPSSGGCELARRRDDPFVAEAKRRRDRSIQQHDSG